MTCRCAYPNDARCTLHVCQRCYGFQLVWPTVVRPDRLGFVLCECVEERS